MIIQRLGDGFGISAPAKVNLFLEVLGKRSDGYHQVETLLCPISLFDQLTLEPSEGAEIDFRITLPSAADETSDSRDIAWDIPSDDRNLVVRAVRLVQQNLGTNQGCRIHLRKAIPAAAGLGGGSSDAAAAVVASLLAFAEWDRSLAHKICSQLGSDVSFFLGDEAGIGLMLASGRGEDCQALASRPHLEFVVTHPPVGCSTKQVYLNYAERAEYHNTKEIVAACENGQYRKIGAQLFNALQLPASMLTEWIDRQLLLFKRCGAPYALISGSGSSCFALTNEQDCQRRIMTESKKLGLSRVYLVQSWYGDSIEKQLGGLLG